MTTKIAQERFNKRMFIRKKTANKLKPTMTALSNRIKSEKDKPLSERVYLDR